MEGRVKLKCSMSYVRVHVPVQSVSTLITSYPVVGSRAIPRGFLMSLLIRTVRLVPVRSDTVTCDRDASVQYILSETQSIARPSGGERRDD